MTATHASNSGYVEVLAPEPLENVGWTVRVLSERDYTSVIAEVTRFSAAGFTAEANAEGGGKVTLDGDDRIWTDPLPESETTALIDQEALWQVLHNGLVRAEFLAEDVAKDVILGSDGPRGTVISGRGTGTVLSWAKALPRTYTKLVDKTKTSKKKTWNKKTKRWTSETVSTTIHVPTTKVYSERSWTEHPMQTWVRVFGESQNDGYLGFVKCLFDAETDSAGQPWSGTQEVTVNAGDDLLTLLKRYSEQWGLAWRMLPGFRLQVFQTYGADLSNTVVFPAWRGQSEHSLTATRRDIATDIYVSSGDTEGKTFAGIVSHVRDTDAGDRFRRRMAWVTTSDTVGSTGRGQIASATLAQLKNASVSRTIKVETAEGRYPFIDYQLHDWIGVENPDTDQVEPQQVLGIAVDVDANLAETVELTMQTVREALAVRLQRQVTGLGAGVTSGSGASTASAVSSYSVAARTVAATSVTDLTDVAATDIEAGDLLQWDGDDFSPVTPELNALFDVDLDTAAPANGQALVWDSTAQMWKPGTVSGGGSSGFALTEVYEVSDGWLWWGSALSGTAYDAAGQWAIWKINRDTGETAGGGLGTWSSYATTALSADFAPTYESAVVGQQTVLEADATDGSGVWIGTAPFGAEETATTWLLTFIGWDGAATTTTGSWAGRES